MRAWAAHWAWRLLVAPRVRAYLYHGPQGETVVYTPEEIVLVFPGAKVRRTRRERG